MRPIFPRFSSILLLGTSLFTNPGCSVLPTASTSYAPPQTIAHIQYSALEELSGLAPSRFSSGVYWSHNDSGDQPRLFALNAKDEHLGTLGIDGVEARDWEDIASFVFEGKSWLLIADVGDNDAIPHDICLLLLPEPDPTAFANAPTLHASPSKILKFNYPEGPRDCEDDMGVLSGATKSQELTML
ncbi:MAG: hypothetical protein J6386_15305 [Candidatus Synoicihabitans palmerolidicus]|nr:hypothetical protein [Candidatus Synoicihabitans palmerolidicus]